MKVCPRCQTRYDEVSRFCRKDGAELVPDRAVAPEVVARRELLERRIAQDPEDTGLLEELGDLLAEVPLYDEALVQYFKALELAPPRDVVRRKVARVYRARGDWGEAARHLETLVEGSPADLELLGELAEAYVQSQRRPEAAQVLARMAELAPADTDLWRRRRALLEELRREGELLGVYRRLAELAPEELANWLALARRILAEGVPAAPEELARLEARLTAARAGPEVPSGQRAARLGLYLAAVRLKLGASPSSDEALADLLTDVDPAALDAAHAALGAESLAELGDRALRVGETGRAIEWFGRALRFSDLPRARSALARVYGRRAEEHLAAGRLREGVAACDEGLAKAPGDGALEALQRLLASRRRRRSMLRLAGGLAAVLVLALAVLYTQRRGPFGEEPNAADLTASFGAFLKSQDGVSDFRKGAAGREFTFAVKGDTWRVVVEAASAVPANDDTGSYRGTLQTRWEKNGATVGTRRALPPELVKAGLGPRLNDARYNRFRKRWKW